MEKPIIKKPKRLFWHRHFLWLVFMAMVFIVLLDYVLFHLQDINQDLLVDALPRVLSRGTLKRLRDILFPFLTLEVEEALPHKLGCAPHSSTVAPCWRGQEGIRNLRLGVAL
ncbi:transmembrane and coiled-coil domain-containing protein 5B-like [Nycticebus coucang]|uniref:transmembrane and coiled-coil domain-containing protein 5B-like n=1 Tax=Nycticebus coucang TaxID=9470 RepID=UPI00234C1A79|nr:transmembrane and coiled-coil domain-containing protein 5B-like [Nycticebus coucang]